MKRLIKNLGLQTIYQILVTAIPLITSPYLSRVLGAAGLGTYSYTYSIVNYFVLFAMLGLTNYGSRTIAMAENEDEERKLFWEIHALQILTTFIMTVLYVIALFIFISENQLLYIIQLFWLLSCFIDINWFFFGKEEFEVTIIRNAIIKIITVASLFLFVHEENDVWIYTVIMAGGNFVSQIMLYMVALKKVKFEKPIWKGIIAHVKPNIVLFIPVLGMSVYHLMDKTMLGLLSNYSECGYYYNADKVINIPLGVVAGIGTVMLPKVSSMRAEGKNIESIKMLAVSINVFSCIAVAMMFGIAAVATEFVPVFFGTGYEACVSLILLMSPVMLFKTLSNVIRSQYLIPYNKESVYIVSVFVGAFVNFIINYFLIGIQNMGALGATIGTVIAEFIVCFIQFVASEKELHLFKELLLIIPYMCAGTIMYYTVRYIASVGNNVFVKLITEVLIGGAVYLLLSGIYFVIYNKVLKNKVR